MRFVLLQVVLLLLIYFWTQKDTSEENEKADQLARMASTENTELEEGQEPIQTLTHSSISDQASKLAVIKDVSDWRKAIINYLENGTLPTEKKSVVQLKIKAGRFAMLNGTLYKKGFTLPLLKCVSPEKRNYILREIHERVCGNHSGSRVLAHKAVRAGFYWPDISKDSVAIVRNCDKCQRFANITKQPPMELSSISSPWPFSQWGVDIMGPLPRGKGGVRFAVVVVYYFTKWVEVEALVNITTKSIVRFLWKNVICRYGIPHAFMTNNRKQFDCDSFRK